MHGTILSNNGTTNKKKNLQLKEMGKVPKLETYFYQATAGLPAVAAAAVHSKRTSLRSFFVILSSKWTT
jgi:hypothetical protein